MPSAAQTLIALQRVRARRQGARGFTLIEAIVAIAIAGIALVPLITFVGQMTTALMRAGDANARSLAQQASIEFLETLNPLEQPIGQDQIGDLIIRWESRDIIKPNTAMRANTGLAAYSLGFYDVQVTVEQAGRGPWFTFDMRKVGFRILVSRNFPGMPP